MFYVFVFVVALSVRMSRLGAAAITPRGLVDAALWSRVRAQYTMQFAHSQPQHQRDFCVAVARRVERYHYVSRAPMRIAALQRSSNAKEIAGMLSFRSLCLRSNIAPQKKRL
jgi:hypothetical protein